ncbi:HD domain-containing protein [Heliobacillus mobilis]|uniref:HD domain-containing protein n=1 Tax=Heliobacterium mobile TaxID=28064 RepID=A0A6I3SQK4_HELMO|nr:HD domain-containing phosphohydrolase [Heliobacterium mobile]MTV50692.1 HD domain-containing protein [Heliobacterium mobile]
MAWIRHITFRYWLTMTLISLIGIVAMAGHYVRVESAYLEDNLRKEALSRGNVLASAVSVDMLKGDYSRINSLAYSILATADVQYVTVYDTDGRIVNQSGENNGRDLLVETVPIMYFYKPLGMVEVAMRADKLQAQKKLRLWYTGSVAFTVFCLAMALSTFLSRRMTAPLRRMTMAAQEMTEGNRVCVQVEGPDEIAALASAFNQMSAAVAQQEELLNREIQKATATIQEKLATLEAMDQIFRAVLGNTLRREEVVRAILEHVKDLVPTHYITVAMWEDEKKTANFYIWETQSGGMIVDTVPIETTLIPRLMEERKPLIRPNLRKLALFPHEEELLVLGVHSSLSVPLAANDKVIGIITVGHREPEFYGDEHVQRLSEMAQVVSMALVSANTYGALQDSFWAMIKTLSRAIDLRDAYTGGHSEQVMLLSRAIARHAGLTEGEIETIGVAGLLHDVGKIGIKESVLQKPGPLNDVEFAEMKGHSAMGAELLRPIKLFREVATIVYHHHERYDGRGYPQCLSGEDIPLASRVIAIADAIDAMASDRPYRKRLPAERIREELVRHAGSQFDPRLVDAILPHFNELIGVAFR